MRKWFVWGLALGVGFLGAQRFLTAKEAKELEYSIKEVMKLAHKSKLMQKIAAGDGSKEDKEKLLKLYIALSEDKPEKGSLADWKKRTGAMVKVARAVVAGKDGSEAQLKKAVNCGACHKLHKPMN
jgi:hypothetical protein